MPVMNVAKFERFFRLAASLDVDKKDLRRYNEFIDQETYNLLIRAQATAKANGRDVIQPCDIPITKGLQERMHEFKELDQEIELKEVLDQLTKRPPLDLAYSDATEAKLPSIAGGLSVALARSFKVIEPGLKNPQTEHWERAFDLFALVL